MDEFWAFGQWILETTVPPIVVVGLLGFAFREKWKQILSKSLQTDLDRQRHDFARDLEAYKVSLIAQAEAMKLKADVQKSITNKYLERKFDRLLTLEADISKAGMAMSGFLAYPPIARTANQLGEAIALLNTLTDASAQAEMFLEPVEQQAVLNLRKKMADLLDFVGPNREVFGGATPVGIELMQLRIAAERSVRDKVHALAAL
jgi:hypothetical protein